MVAAVICPRCKRDFVRGDVSSETVHRPIGNEGVERIWLCGYTSQSFLELDTLPSTVLSTTIRRLWKTLDHHISKHGDDVEVEGPDGWVDVRDVINDGLTES